MKYRKGRHCNNECKFFCGSWETVYNPHHGGNPGSTDYDVYVMSCDAKEIELNQIVYNCPLYRQKESE